MTSIVERIREYMRRKAVRAMLRKAISVLCCLVVFVTTYALILPSLAMEKEGTCGKEVHVHTEDCFPNPTSLVEKKNFHHYYHTSGAAITNYSGRLPLPQAQLAQEITKGNYDLGFITLLANYDQKALENARQLLGDRISEFAVPPREPFLHP